MPLSAKQPLGTYRKNIHEIPKKKLTQKTSESKIDTNLNKKKNNNNTKKEHNMPSPISEFNMNKINLAYVIIIIGFLTNTALGKL